MMQMVSTTTMVASWANRQDDVRLDFYAQPPEYTLHARLFQKNVVTDNVVDTGIVIFENQMKVAKSLYDLMGSDKPKASKLIDFDPEEKEAIMKTLNDRNITVNRHPHSVSIVIYAFL